ncbi:hypothetical protein SAMN05421504_102581 [Amycolatopsis xylanica]|uniref:DUF4352 domain-containing protein n=1 Tax=Amycolatopsis xylanica TaxID=589385 RepID=A0A1H2ZN30_9PSEU|nr:hypothetical protein [Amycolatopsis xylanica]SDX18378.1 hypothetical protein SAMN05421504_102581 [Amycolatopsis xylanica]
MTAMPPLAPMPVAQARPVKFGALAWTALILGIAGIVGSPILIFNNLTAVVAGVGFILGVIAFFGTKKTLAAVGVALCVAAIVFTVLAQNAAVKELDKITDQLTGSGPAQTLSVGDTFHGKDIDLTVANPKEFTTGKYSMRPNAKAMSYDVTVVNHSAKPWTAMLLIQATAGNAAAEQVFDTEAGFNGTPSQDVLPGKELTFKLGFVDGPGDITVQVGTFGDDKAYFIHKR